MPVGIKYRANPVPPNCNAGRWRWDEISGRRVHEDFLVENADGFLVDSRNTRTLDDRPDLEAGGPPPQNQRGAI